MRNYDYFYKLKGVARRGVALMDSSGVQGNHNFSFLISHFSFLLRTYLWTVLVFVIAKVGFMLACHEATPVLTIADVKDVVVHGLTLDLSTALYFLIVPFLTVIVSVWWANGKVLRRVLRVYFVLIAIAFALAFVADASLYPFWGFKLDSTCLGYLESPTEVAASVTGSYLLWRVVAIVIIAVLIFRGYNKFPSSTYAPYRAGAYVETLFYILLIPLFVIGIRGGIAESTTNVGQVYFSQNQFLNHSAVNPVFSFLSSLERTANHIVDYDFYAPETCKQLTTGLYPTTSTGTDTLLNTSRPDIVIILMESAGELMASYMPCLQQLKEEGIDFTNCYGNTWRTDRGTVCTYSGYPSFPTSSVMKMPRKTAQLPGIASALRQEGYRTSYLYGGDINFTNMRSYLVATGWEQLTWMADYTTEEQNTAKWGVRDDITFNTLYEQITDSREAGDSRRHRLYGFSTLSSHEPWDVPVRLTDETIPNAFAYLDRCIGDFVTRLRQTPQWDNLLIILLPDHSIDYRQTDEASPERNRIPMVWVGGAVRKPRKVSQICNQTDLAATLLAQMGLPHEQFKWSRDVLSATYTYPFAIHTYNNGFSVTDSTGFMAYDLASRRVITDRSSQAERLEQVGKAILQATTEDLREK